MTGIGPWPGISRAESEDAELDALALVRAILRRDRDGLRAILHGRGLTEISPDLCLAGELAVLAANLAWSLGGEDVLDEYQRQAS